MGGKEGRRGGGLCLSSGVVSGPVILTGVGVRSCISLFHSNHYFSPILGVDLWPGGNHGDGTTLATAFGVHGPPSASAVCGSSFLP